MKKIIFVLLMIVSFSFVAVSAQTTQKLDPLGKWKFEAPYAPEGFTTGNIQLSFADNKYTTGISFTGSDYVIPGDRTKVENDMVTFYVYIEGNEITISLKQESNVKMAGKAVYSEGEIPLTLTREAPQK
jgi:hypothetical protein